MKSKQLSFFLLVRVFVSMERAKWLLIASGIFLVAAVVADIQIVEELGAIIDHQDLKEAPFFEMVAWLLLLCVLTRLCGVLQFVMAILATNHAVEAFRKEFFKKLLGLSKKFYDENKVGWVLARATGDMNTLLEFFAVGLTLLMYVLVFLSIALVRIGHIAPILLLPLILFFPVTIFLTLWFRDRMSNNQRLLTNSNSRLIAHLTENIRGIRITQAFAREEANRVYFKRHNQRSFQYGIAASRLSGIYMPTMEFIGLLGVLSVMVFGTWLIEKNYILASGVAITPGELATCLLYLNMMLLPTRMIVEIYGMAISAMASAERIFDIFDQKPDVQDVAEVMIFSQLRGHIEFRNVEFRYHKKSDPIFQNMNLSIKAKETVALVGKTGAGKSTLAYLIARFYDVSAGQITIDGVDVREFSQMDLHHSMGIVLQEGFLFSGTILDNIRFRQPNLSLEEVIEITKRLGTHDAIMRIPANYEHRVGEGGYALSQGQRQLISFSRALTANPQLLILDEATSSVDTYTESVLTKAMDQLIQNRTTLIIAHRLSTIEHADRILVIGEGGILEQGNFAELLEQNGHFAALYHTHQKVDQDK